MPLSARDAQILDLAGARYRFPGARESDAFERFGLTPVLFWRSVNRLLDDPAALAHDPLAVKRLQRLRDQRRRVRQVRVS